MKLVALEGGIGVLADDGDHVLELAAPEASLAAWLASGRDCGELREAQVRRSVPLAQARFEPLVGSAAIVWGVGLNYRSKAVASGRSLPDEPVLFIKAPSAVAGPGEPIRLPSASSAVDVEAELAVVVNRPLRNATPAEARAAIAGYLAANDVTARDVMRATGNPSLAKSFPSFGQFGAVLATADGTDLGVTMVTSTVDGQPWQSDSAEGMLLDPAELLATISRYALLRPGDVLLTGTPAGSGDERGEYLRPGAEVVVTVGDLPPLTSMVTADDLEEAA